MPYQRPRTAIGLRRDRVRIQRLPTVDDGMGGQVPADANGWKTVMDLWVMPVPLDERTHERIDAAQLTAKHSYHFDARYYPQVTPQMRLIWRGKTLEIQTVTDDDGRKRRMILYCSEVQ